MDMNGLRLTPHQVIFEDENNITVVFPNGTEYAGYCVCVSGGGLTGASGADGNSNSSSGPNSDSCCPEYYDENESLIATNPSEIHFIGPNVCAVSPDGGTTLNVYIPCPNQYSNFNSNNGNCDARLSDPITSLRHISSPYLELKETPCGNGLGDYIIIRIDIDSRPMAVFDYFKFSICYDKNKDGSEFEKQDVILLIRDTTELAAILSGVTYTWFDNDYQFKLLYNIGLSQLTITKDSQYINSFIEYIDYFDEYNAILDSYLFSSEVDALYKTFDIGDWESGSVHDVINNPIITYNNSCPIIFGYDSKFMVFIYNWKGIVIGENYISNIVGDLIASKEGIIVNIHDWEQSAFSYIAIVDITIDISKTLPNGGRFYIYIKQEDSAGNIYTYLSHELFYDPNSMNPSFSDVRLDAVIENIKWTSGVARYALGTVFDIAFFDLMNLNNLTYPDDFLVADLSDYMLPNKVINPSDLDPWTNLWNYSANPVRVNSGYNLSTTDVFFENPNGRIKATWTDWVTSPVISGSNFPMLIDTLLPISTDLAEEFVDESFRLLPDLSDYRDPTQLLGNDELQVYDNILVRKLNKDYTVYNPVNTANYISNYNNQYYYREFKSSNVSYYNGLFHLGGILKESIIKNNQLLIDISLDGVNWFSCNKDYLGNSILSDGDGCRINRDSVFLPDLQFTLGARYISNTSGSNKLHQLTGNPYYGLFVRICFTPQFSGQLEHIRIIDWT